MCQHPESFLAKSQCGLRPSWKLLEESRIIRSVWRRAAKNLLVIS